MMFWLKLCTLQGDLIPYYSIHDQYVRRGNILTKIYKVFLLTNYPETWIVVEFTSFGLLSGVKVN